MAKGDSQEMQQLINRRTGMADTGYNQLNANQQGLNQQMRGNYTGATGMNMPDYSAVMNSYRQFLGGGNPSGGQQQQPTQAYQQPQVNSPMTNPDGSQSGYAGQQTSVPQGSQAGGNGAAQNLQNRDKLDQTVISVANSGLTGQAGIDAINKAMGYDTGIEWDPTRGNFMASTGGSNGVQYDTNAQGVYGAHPYDDAGSSGGGNGQGAIAGFQNFAQTGGFSPQDIQDIRARAIAPTRAIYQNAQNDLQTQMARTGGYMPNYGAVASDLARKANYGISDANVNADAAIAQMVQQGKLYGLTGMSNAQLGALSGMTGLFGTTPALSSTFGNQVLQSGNQGIDLQNSLNNANQIALNAKNAQSQIPGNFQQGLGNVASVGNLIGGVANMGASAFGKPPIFA